MRKHPNLLNQNTFMGTPYFTRFTEPAKGRQNDVITLPGRVSRRDEVRYGTVWFTVYEAVTRIHSYPCAMQNIKYEHNRFQWSTLDAMHPNSTVRGLSWKGHSYSSGQETPQFLLNPTTDLRVHKSTISGPILSQFNPAQPFRLPSVSEIHFQTNVAVCC